MMEFLLAHWGDVFSAVGLVVSLFGLIWAIWEARRARRAAETAAEAAERGASEAAGSIARTLAVADIQKAIDLIDRLKDRHSAYRWEAAVERYPDLRGCCSILRLGFRIRTLRNGKDSLTLLDK